MNKNYVFAILLMPVAMITLLAGCSGYSSRSLFPEGVRTVCIEMFDNTTFRRDLEYELTDALAKRIESETPYKIIHDKNRADTVINGRIISIGESVLTYERATGRPLEKQADVVAVFSWKNLRTGEFITENKKVSAVATFSQFQEQGFDYASKVAANRLAERIVEQMQTAW